VDVSIVKLDIGKTENPSRLTLTLNSSYPELQKLIPTITKITIKGLNSTEYNYSIKSPVQSDSQVFDLFINYSAPIVKNPVIKASLNLPLALENNPIFALSSEEISVTSPTYFAMDPSTSEDIPRAKGGSKAGGYLLSTTTLLVSFLDPASSVGIYGLLNVGMINNLRYENLS
jgi:hypothetical protein